MLFASITAKNANLGTQTLREALLNTSGFVSGVWFVSITPNWSRMADLTQVIVRAFNGGSRETACIESGILDRYRG